VQPLEREKLTCRLKLPLLYRHILDVSDSWCRQEVVENISNQRTVLSPTNWGDIRLQYIMAWSAQRVTTSVLRIHLAVRNMELHRRPLPNLGMFPGQFQSEIGVRIVLVNLSRRIAKQLLKAIWLRQVRYASHLLHARTCQMPDYNLASGRKHPECSVWLFCHLFCLSYNSFDWGYLRESYPGGKTGHLSACHLDRLVHKVLEDVATRTRRLLASIRRHMAWTSESVTRDEVVPVVVWTVSF